MLSPSDFLVLHTPLIKEAQSLLPMPVEAALYILDDTGLLWPLLNPEAEQKNTGLPYPDKEQPRIIKDDLIIPLLLENMPKMALVIRAADPFLLKKLSPAWQKELQSKLLPHWIRLRPIYIDPGTELYNQRAASIFLQEEQTLPGFFFLIHIVFYKSSAANSLQKLRELADILQFFNIGPCFSFGYGVFGLFLQSTSRDQALKTAHFLQRQLKRDRMHKVQIAFVPTNPSSNTSRKLILEKSWQALSIAEKRGPFAIYNLDTSTEGDHDPFQLHSPELIKTLQAAWRKQSRFTLLAISYHPESPPLDNTDYYAPQGKIYLGYGKDPDFILLSDIDPGDAENYIKATWQKLLTTHAQKTFIIGTASWPCLDFKKNDMPPLCMKALLHGSFLGSGSMVFFNHLSLNISGDAYFEDGDYRAAIREYRQGLRMQENEVNLLNSLGVALIECGQERQAAQCFQDVLRQEADNYMALINLGHVRQAQGIKEEALHCFERARQVLDAETEESTSGQELFFPLSRLYIEFAEYTKAISVLEQWHDRPGNKRDFQLFRLMGQCYMEIEEAQKAIRACQHGLQIFSRDSISLSILGLLYVEQGEGSEIGLNLCARALELNRFNPDLWCRLAQAQRCAGLYDESLTSIKQCLQLNRQHKEGNLQLALIHLALHHMAEARNRLRKVAEWKLSPKQQRLLQSALASLNAKNHRARDQA